MSTKSNIKPRRRLLNLAVLAALGASALVPASASAVDLYWVCGSDWWENAACWSPSGPPQPYGDSAYLTQSGTTDITVDYSNTAYLSTNLGYLTIDATGAGTMTLSQHQGVLNVGAETIGLYGVGIFKQSGGTNWAGGGLTLGSSGGSSGTYNLLNNGDLRASSEIIGEYGTGVFIQNSGTNWVDTVLNIGASGMGRYDMSGGYLWAWRETIGYGRGTFTQSGGTHTVSDTLYLNGSYDLSGTGSLTTGTEYIAGAFTQTGGTHTVNYHEYIAGTFNQYDGTHTVSDLRLGGSYDLRGSGSLTAIGETIGGTFTQTGGTHTVSGALYITGGNSKSYILKDGSLSANYEVIGGYNIGDMGTFIQSGGDHNVNNLTVSGSNYPFYSSYTLSGGRLSADREIITRGGVFTQSGGTNTTNDLYLDYSTYTLSGDPNTSNTITNDLHLDYSSTYTLSGGKLKVDGNIVGGWYGGTGNLHIDGGSLNVGGGNGSITVYGLVLGSAFATSGSHTLSGIGSIAANTEHIGLFGTGAFTQTGGTNTVSNFLSVGSFNGSSSYNMSDGILWADFEGIGSGSITGTFTQSGGLNTANYIHIGGGIVGGDGTYNYSGGTLKAGTIDNFGTFNQSGHTTVTGTPATGTTVITNWGTYHVTGSGNRIEGDFTNYGTFKITGTTEVPADIVFTGTFTGNSGYSTDPADSHFTNLIINSTGYFVGGTGDNFFIGNDFTNLSENTLWDTSHARLVFDTGADALHDFTLGGLAGSEAFSWGTLELAAGNTLNLFGLTFYVDTLVLGSGANFNLDGATVYYRHLVSNGGHFSYLHGAQLTAWGGGPTAPVPEPETWAMLLAGLGLLGFSARRRKQNA